MSIFSNHGTKIIGAVTAAASVLQSTDPTVLAAVVGPKGFNWIMALMGILTIVRGVQNSNAQVPKP